MFPATLSLIPRNKPAENAYVYFVDSTSCLNLPKQNFVATQ